jgi:hypothetical protein
MIGNFRPLFPIRHEETAGDSKRERTLEEYKKIQFRLDKPQDDSKEP